MTRGTGIPASITARGITLTGASVECPHCHNQTGGVINSRLWHGKIRRRRVCGQCHQRFTTLEQPALDTLVQESELVRMLHDIRSAKQALDRAEQLLLTYGADDGN